ncbi:MAG: hypothetical protein OXI80_15355 [Caldilineaceae bacterium]|nr:hypothetical protein [Caldilineaceae bacterium]MDE0339047.1 hypothetical protein [Caldilineaceae bacterium]
MLFKDWLEEHLRRDMILPEDCRDGRTITLKDTQSDIAIKVENVPRSSVVVNLEIGGRRQVFETDNGREFHDRCDYLILEESETEYTAVFIELKTTFENYAAWYESDEKGKSQLRWSLPCLQYLLSVFETDAETRIRTKPIRAWYFLAAKNVDLRFNRRRTVDKFDSDNYRGLPVHYVKEDKMELEDLKAREPLLYPLSA